MKHTTLTTSSFEAFWKAEIIRRQEAAQGPFADQSLQRELDEPANLQERALSRAAHLIERQQFAAKLQRYQLLWRVVVWAILLVAGITGVSIAVQITPTHLRSVSIIEALLMLIGLNSLLIGVWLASVLAKPRARGIVGWVLQLFTNRQHSPEAILVATAHSSVMQRHGLIKPTFSSLSHLFWAILLGSAILTLIARFIAFEYEFVWRTTLLSQPQIDTVLAWLHAVPQLFGLPRPDVVQSAPSAQVNRNIALWLLLCIGVYALVPRLLLLIGSEWVRRRRLAGLELDWTLAGWSELRQQWQQAPQFDVDSAPAMIQRHGPATPLVESETPALVLKDQLAITLDWSTPDHNQLTQLLGSRSSLLIVSANSAKQRQQVLRALAHSTTPPQVLVLVNPQLSPDRGTLRLLDTLHSYASIKVGLVDHGAPEKQQIWLDYLTTHLAQIQLVTLPEHSQATSFAQAATQITEHWLDHNQTVTL